MANTKTNPINKIRNKEFDILVLSSYQNMKHNFHLSIYIRASDAIGSKI
jgi:hypothetical protein